MKQKNPSSFNGLETLKVDRRQSLVIVDLTFAGQLQGSPTYHRRVQVFPRHLSRTGVLQELNLADPCVIEADRCTLHLNNALWAKEMQLRVNLLMVHI